MMLVAGDAKNMGTTVSLAMSKEMPKTKKQW